MNLNTVSLNLPGKMPDAGASATGPAKPDKRFSQAMDQVPAAPGSTPAARAPQKVPGDNTAMNAVKTPAPAPENPKTENPASAPGNFKTGTTAADPEIASVLTSETISTETSADLPLTVLPQDQVANVPVSETISTETPADLPLTA
ncbi:MAG: hypothetical protein RQ899_10090, partial [Pseudomonadales bacterium]|nr:hypothetical protein [Pseudomonadales bacterium]